MYASSPYLFTLQFVIWLAIAGLAWAFWLNANALTEDIERKRDLAEQPADDALRDRPPAPPERDRDPVEQAILYFRGQGYDEVRSYQGTDDVQIRLYAKDAHTTDGLYRREGAIIFPSGDSAKISAGVLHDSDSWQLGSEFKIQRARVGRSIKIKTALDRPHIKSLVDRNHHVLTIGLASRETESTAGSLNLRLSYARGYNLGYTIWELGWKPLERIYPLYLGPAKQAPADPNLEPLQRSAVIVGVNGTVEVLSSDAVIAAMLLIDSNVVDLNAYTIPAARPQETERIAPRDGLMSAESLLDRVRRNEQGDTAIPWQPIRLPPTGASE